jgi:hypothetical protein
MAQLLQRRRNKFYNSRGIQNCGSLTGAGMFLGLFASIARLLYAFWGLNRDIRLALSVFFC